jgi:acetyl-CoA C-acetyltransferase
MTGRAAVLVSAARTPIGRFGGALADVPAVDLGGLAVAGALAGLDPALPVDHVFLGNVVQAGSDQNPGRVAGVRGGLPTTVPASTLNDVCLASMTASTLAATLIRAGEIDCGGGGPDVAQAARPHPGRHRAVGGQRGVRRRRRRDRATSIWTWSGSTSTVGRSRWDTRSGRPGSGCSRRLRSR